MFVLNEKHDLGKKRFSENEIIDFALRYDPLDFHLSVEAAKKSLFKDLVASGPHPFHHFYKNHWIPRFGKTVVAGLGLDNWRFLKPIYANDEVHCVITIREITPHPGKGTVTLKWWFEFQNTKGELFQHLEMMVLHKN
jgi:acyl dehydratase